MQLRPVLVAKKPQVKGFSVNLYPKYWAPTAAQIIKNSGTDIGIHPEDQKSKAAKPLESSYVYEIFRLEESEFLSHRHLTFLSSAGIKGVHSNRPASMTN